MAEEFSINVDGIEEVCALLSEAPKDVVRHTVAKALIAACVPVAQTLNYNAPELTGDMVDHLVTDVRVMDNETGGTADIGFGKEGWKARLVEFGHRAIGHKPGLKQLAIGSVPPHRFMKLSTEQSAEAAVEAFRDSVDESIGTRNISQLNAA